MLGWSGRRQTPRPLGSISGTLIDDWRRALRTQLFVSHHISCGAPSKSNHLCLYLSLSPSRCRSTAQRSSSVRHPGNETRVVDVYATLLICGITSTHTSWSHLSRVRECDVLLKLSTHKPSRRPSWALSKSHTGTTNDLHLGTHYHAIWRSNCYATTSGERSGFFFNVWMSCIGSVL